MFLPFSSSSIDKEDKLEISTNFTELLIRNPIDLSLTIIAVKRNDLKVPGVKKICNNYKFYYYCK